VQRVHEPSAVVASVTVAVALRLVSVWSGKGLPRPHWINTGNFKVPTDEHATRKDLPKR